MTYGVKPLVDALLWVLLLAMLIYGVATILASIKVVPEGKVGVVTDRSGRRRVIGMGAHVVQPFGHKVKLYPKGPVRMDGELRDVVTLDGWRISAHFQLSARLVDELAVSEAGGDWRDVTLDAAHRVLRTELENNDSTDLRPRPQALDAGVTEEINVLSRRWGVEADWLRVTIRWAFAVPPAHVVPSPQPSDGHIRRQW